MFFFDRYIALRLLAKVCDVTLHGFSLVVIYFSVSFSNTHEHRTSKQLP